MHYASHVAAVALLLTEIGAIFVVTSPARYYI